MKTLLLGLLMLGVAHSSFALNQEDLDKRVRAVTAKLDVLQSKPDKAIPAELLRKAEGIILLEKTKGGHGVAMIKEAKSRKWGTVAFMASDSSSFGLQAGGEHSFYVILIMNTNSARMMTEPNFDFGGEARGTAGNAHGGADSTVSSADQPVLIYDDRTGFYNGAVMKGGTLSPDDKANTVYYGSFFTMKDILFDKKVKATQPAIDLATKLNEFAKKPKN